MTLTRAAGSLVALLLVTLSACSFSYSSKSLSDSIESSSGSVSASLSSSSPGSGERAYKRDVRDYTAAYVSTGEPANYDTFQADLGKLAEKHGITNWESNLATYVAIGEGLGKANVNDAQLLAYKRTLGRGDATRMDAIQQGYDSTR